MGRDFVMPNRGSSRVPGLKGAHGVGGHALPAAGEAQSFAGRGFHTHGFLVNPESTGEGFAHFANVRGKLRALGDDHGVDVLETEPAARGHRHHFAEKLQTVRALVSIIRIGEVGANITHRRSAQHGVANGVGQYVRIGVTGEAFFEGNLDTAQNEPPALFEPVNIETNTNPDQTAPSAETSAK